MKKVLLVVVVVISTVGLGTTTVSADPICVGAGVEPAWVTVCTP